MIIILSATVPHSPLMEAAKAKAPDVFRASIALSRPAPISFKAPNSQGLQFVHNYIKSNDQGLTEVRQRSIVPFTIIDSIFNHYNLPLELKYVAVVESELKTTAISPVGAKGPWQFMPNTAHIFGLKVNKRSDERINYYKSTKAAARYLRDLHAQFGDWLLVLAAYNGGASPVYKAIHKSHSRDFWTLQRFLPKESRQYVKKFIATAYYFENETTPKAIAKQEQVPVKEPVKVQSIPIKESTDDKFRRLMKESAQSLQKSNELLEPNTLLAEVAHR
jgi:Transglycosylase SLT domain